MNRENVIANYINAVERILIAFHLNIEPESEDISIVTLKTKEFLNALRELYLSNETNKDEKYEVIFEVINKASFHIVKERFGTNRLGIWAVIIFNLELANSHISELHFKETNNFYPFPDIETTPHQTETKTDKLKQELGKYGFFELPKVKQLSEPNKQSLIELISTNGIPYSIAMFDFLDFLKHLETEHFTTKNKLNKEVSKWFNSDKDGRAVKGNISSLLDFSTENKSKYTAHTHKESVKTDYQKLK